ncbi:hypothetical protein OGAPHI_002055 [Ogataea philodendri]|uniref:Uncharacterized protein n=1 Tax=Ogataea philodendri TaxID=1378263 RepID=A0A9P8T7T6_9ASCO|nr:uncharacterized protein OGAPHI_002055 [Ogataea philodendri]KAH3668301.1 hypothetical protein OGAPHI_002055 [Ogataea philodendri]
MVGISNPLVGSSNNKTLGDSKASKANTTLDLCPSDKHWWRQSLNLWECETEDSVWNNRLNQTVGLHLVKDLLSGLGLSNQVSISTSRSNELFDMLDFFLLFVVLFHLVGFQFGSGLDVSIVVTTVHGDLLQSHVNHVGTNTVQEILRVRNKNQGLVEPLQVFFQPNTGFQIQVGSWVVQQKQGWLDEQSLGKSNSHLPSSGHVHGSLLDGGGIETKTGQNNSSSGFKRSWVHLVDSLVQWLQQWGLWTLVNNDILNFLFQTGKLGLSFSNDPL